MHQQLRRVRQPIRLLVGIGQAIAIASVLAGLPQEAAAKSSMRCGVHLIKKGALREEVLAKCGRPYSTYGRYWLYLKGNVVYRLYLNSDGRIRRVKCEIRR